jgi:hypothetical protein
MMRCTPGTVGRTSLYSAAIGATIVHVWFVGHQLKHGGDSNHCCCHNPDADGHAGQQDAEQRAKGHQRDAEEQDSADEVHALTVSLHASAPRLGPFPPLDQFGQFPSVHLARWEAENDGNVDHRVFYAGRDARSCLLMKNQATPCRA